MISLFRCREYAQFGPTCEEYQYIKSLLPPESLCHAQFRDSKTAWFEHRLKDSLDLAGNDSNADACCLGIATCWWQKYLNDNSGTEFLSAGLLYSLLELQNICEFVPGHPMTGFAAGLRRTVVHLRSRQTTKRPTKKDRINVRDCVLFDSIWHDAESTTQYLGMLDSYESKEHVPMSLKNEIAARAVRYANDRLDHIDQAVFGGIVPDLPFTFQKLVDFWQVLGIEWLVAREALHEFQPDSLLG